VAVLLDDEHDGETLELTGREAVTLREAVAQLTRARGRTVSYLPETIDEAYASRLPSGAPAYEIDGWVTSYTAIASGELDVVTDTVARVTGHEPVSIPAFLGRVA
jgi:uncharacterized protein YbjT (DUF2867 family)